MLAVLYCLLRALIPVKNVDSRGIRKNYVPLVDLAAYSIATGVIARW